MLLLTGAAAASIRSLVAGLPVEAGLRIALEKPGNGIEPEFSLCIVRCPEADDEVIEQHGARVFVDPSARGYFQNRLLDADGEVFTFAPTDD